MTKNKRIAIKEEKEQPVNYPVISARSREYYDDWWLIPEVLEAGNFSMSFRIYIQITLTNIATTFSEKGSKQVPLREILL